MLVAIAAMALLALMSWRGIDMMVHAQSQMRERADAVLSLQTALAQWAIDLDAVTELPHTQALDWDGRTLRLTRRSSGLESAGIHVVAWTGNGKHWQRWQSPALTTQDDWQHAWNTASAWAQEGAGADTNGIRIFPLNDWQLQAFRNGAWGPVSTTPATGASASLPDGLRLILDLPSGPGLQGQLTRDWVRPTAVVPKS